MNLIELEDQYHGSTLAKLVKHHMKNQSEEDIVSAVRGTYGRFTEDLRPIIDDFTEKYLELWFDVSIYSQDLGTIFSKTLLDINAWGKESRYALTEEDAFNIFNIMVLKIAHYAHSRSEFRKKIGAKKGIFS